MSILAKIPRDSRVRYPVQRFQAAFALGVYDFSIVAGNQNQVLINPMQQNTVYLIERINFYASVPEGAWLEAQPALANFPSFRLSFLNSPSDSIYPEPIRCVNYVDNSEQLIWYYSTREAEQLLISFGGQVNQPASMVGIPTVFSQVNFTMYQIQNQDWVKAFNRGEIDLNG